MQSPELAPSAQEELAFWARELSGSGLHADTLASRIDPARRAEAFPPLLSTTLLDMLRQRQQVDGPLRCLEIGTGPLSTLAHGVTAGWLDVTGIDVLADHYGELLDRHGLGDYPVRPRPGRAEDLMTMFAPGSFDLVYASNSLDHTDDAPRSFDNLVAMTRPGGALVLQHHLNEGTHREWSDSHHWNMDLGDGGLCVTGRDGRTHALGRRADLELAYMSYRSYALDGWIDAVYLRHALHG
ncbi:MAG: methyltransferase domain-containing protein [Planctomycetota bacterium]